MKSSVDIARDHRDILAGNKRTDAGFEFADFAGCRSCAFRKNNQDRSRVCEHLLAKREALPDARLPREGQRVHEHCGGPQSRDALEKII